MRNTKTTKPVNTEKKEATRKMLELIKTLTPEQLDFYQSKGLVTIEGHRLSAKNSAMAVMQNDNATILGGYRQWQEVGRQVKKGEKSITLLAPKIKNDDELGGFFFINVFDISQTDLTELELKEGFNDNQLLLE